MTDIYADLHMHTLFSDGILSPADLLNKAGLAGLKAIAITDHDTMMAHRELQNTPVDSHVTVIPGIEFSCYENGTEVHCLGYYLDATNPDVLEYEHKSRLDREHRAREMVRKLNVAGIRITFDEVLDVAGKAPVTRPHIAAVLVAKRFATSHKHAFDKWLSRGRCAYTPRERFTVRDAVNLTHAAGGVLVVAHPGRTYQDPRLFLSLLSMGIDGIEVYHPSHWTHTTEYYRILAQQHELIVTGGSDYHGTRDHDDATIGTYGVSEEHVNIMHVRSLQRKIHPPGRVYDGISRNP